MFLKIVHKPCTIALSSYPDVELKASYLDLEFISVKFSLSPLDGVPIALNGAAHSVRHLHTLNQPGGSNGISITEFPGEVIAKDGFMNAKLFPKCTIKLLDQDVGSDFLNINL